MENNVDYAELVEQAQLGSQASMNRLAELAEGKLFAYIYRLTLNYDLTQDLLQETLLAMVKSLNNLNKADCFWHWLFRTALGKVQHHYRQEQRKRMIQISAAEKVRLSERIRQDQSDEVNELVRRELSDAVFEAIQKLKLRHRSVLALRCFEQMPYREIAPIMNCSELEARVLFFRAKYSLKQQLSRHGLGKGMLLAALGLFGLMTAPGKAASAAGAVSAASLDVGLAATVIGAAGTKVGITIITAITTAILSLTVHNAICLVGLILYVLFCFLVVSLVSPYRK
jgi:RNA polymerase sigma-70 factor (ECF subfamily)